VPRLTLPEGQSLRQTAARLGVAVEQLARYATGVDLDTPLAATREVVVPDGFLRHARLREGPPEGASTPKQAGMNMWLALDIEQKRTRAAGGLHASQTKDADREGFEEAKRTFSRFEADSNDLCISLLTRVGATISAELRAEAFAYQACAHALRHLMFGDGAERARPQALSSAKAALLANPKLALAHLAMALALEVGADSDSLAAAKGELEAAVRYDPNSAWCWAELSAIERQQGNLTAAEQAASRAMAADAQCVQARLAAGDVALARGDGAGGLQHFEAAAGILPGCAEPHLGTAKALRLLGREPECEEALKRAIAIATTERHRSRLRRALVANDGKSR
jgi:tetratricopeptide (TPR) repeat protein